MKEAGNLYLSYGQEPSCYGSVRAILVTIIFGKVFFIRNIVLQLVSWDSVYRRK